MTENIKKIKYINKSTNMLVFDRNFFALRENDWHKNK